MAETLHRLPKFGAKSYSNFDHTWDNGFEPTALTEHGEEAGHYAYGHAGCIWWEDGQFHEQVWQYGSPVAIVSRRSLRQLIDDVNAEYGDD